MNLNWVQNQQFIILVYISFNERELKDIIDKLHIFTCEISLLNHYKMNELFCTCTCKLYWSMKFITHWWWVWSFGSLRHTMLNQPSMIWSTTVLTKVIAACTHIFSNWLCSFLLYSWVVLPLLKYAHTERASWSLTMRDVTFS